MRIITAIMWHPSTNQLGITSEAADGAAQIDLFNNVTEDQIGGVGLIAKHLGLTINIS